MKILNTILLNIIIIYTIIDESKTQELTLREENNLRPLYRVLREFGLNIIGRSGNEARSLNRAINLHHIQNRMPHTQKFPCSDYINPENYYSNDSNTWMGPRSKERPTSVHALRPGDIDVIGAMGDSLTAANGAAASNIFQVYVENRGISWSIGGQGTWREYFTIPNMLKEFNPKLFGYSLADSLGHHKETQFNVAEPGAMSRDLPHMAWQLVKRMRNDPRVNMKEDWKLVTIMIGANDFCLDSCYHNSPMEIVENHRRELHTALSTIRDNIPRTLVNLVPAPNVGVLSGFTKKSTMCEMTHLFECPCMFGNSQKSKRKTLINKIIPKWRKFDTEIVLLPEFNDREDFTIVSQPFVMDIKFPNNKAGYTDYTYLSTDCFHFSQKGYARAANALWNNMWEPVGNKTLNWANVFETVKCPTRENPYIYTRRNSIKNKDFDISNKVKRENDSKKN